MTLFTRMPALLNRSTLSLGQRQTKTSFSATHNPLFYYYSFHGVQLSVLPVFIGAPTLIGCSFIFFFTFWVLGGVDACFYRWVCNVCVLCVGMLDEGKDLRLLLYAGQASHTLAYLYRICLCSRALCRYFVDLYTSAIYMLRRC